jgi:hypothetical protein
MCFPPVGIPYQFIHGDAIAFKTVDEVNREKREPNEILAAISERCG